jgi:hypothetical protein
MVICARWRVYCARYGSLTTYPDPAGGGALSCGSLCLRSTLAGCEPLAGASACLDFLPPLGAASAASVSCCSDLEERVAELEATAARKGTRKVDLRIMGANESDVGKLRTLELTQNQALELEDSTVVARGFGLVQKIKDG